ncbi:pyruvate kinase [bacterium]|nr:pyruvate kinase [bacterium]
MFKKTKIVCTIGPASYAPEKILELIHCGMNVARINFSHGSHDFHREIIKNIREAEITSGVTIPIIQDLCGPKIRVGKLAKEPLKLLDNEECFITTSDKPEKEDYIPITYKNLNDEIASGDKILIEDGKKALEVLEVIGNVIHCKVLVGGEIYSGKGVNLPNSRLSTSSLTSKDIDDLLFGLQEGVDMIALSFVRKAGDVEAVKTIMEAKGFKKPIIAKIEKPEAVKNIDEIIEAFDMIMVARGDLGVEMPLEKIPLIQKEIIRKCNNLCKPVITATQMLESMMTNPTPTRAEVTDIANAILDGTDAVMLSGETAIGNYPELAVEMMAKTAVEIEKNIDHEGILRRAKTLYGFKIEDAVSLATCHTALNLDIKTIVTTTKSGSTARLVSRYRPKARIIAITPKLSTMRELGICWGVYPVLIDEIKNTDDMFEKVRNYINNSGITEDDKLVIIMAGLPFEIEGITNMMKVERIS